MIYIYFFYYISCTERRIKSDVRWSLHVDTVDELIRRSREGTSLEEFTDVVQSG